VTVAAERVLAYLRKAEFRVREGGITPFGEELPLVTAVAWDRRTAQVALLAEAAGPPDAEAWRQLLFAASGLRHHLGDGEPPGFRSPLILAVVDETTEGMLRELVEELTTRYAVFNRVDLNLIRESDVADDDGLDTALAPLLPVCRRMLGNAISYREVQRFWDVLRDNVRTEASALPEVFGETRERAGEDLAAGLIGDSARWEPMPAPVPIRAVELENFRSFGSAQVPLEQITVLHGVNGSGKSSILEAIELAWAGTSLRRPPGVTAAEYERHLPRSGEGNFVVAGHFDGSAVGVRRIDRVSERPETELPRCVLTQEAVAGLVDSPPSARYANLLAVTGLEIPELDPRTKALVDDAKRSVDSALREIGAPPLPRADTPGLKHLERALAGDFIGRLPPWDEVLAAERALADASDGAYEVHSWPGDDRLVSTLRQVDASLSALRADLANPHDLDRPIAVAVERLRDESQPLRAAARSMRLLFDALDLERPDANEQSERVVDAPLSPDLAVRWLTHSDGLLSAAAGFREDAAELTDSEWQTRLVAYSDALELAASEVPRSELSTMARGPRLPVARDRAAIVGERWKAAGFATAPPAARELLPFIRELELRLTKRADALESLASELERHPAVPFTARARRVLDAMCRFELARNLRRQGPIIRASQDLLRDLLQGQLYPVVRELVAAMVRFEWYFEPLQVTIDGREVLIGGLATPHPDLDARLLLNTAERTVVGVAWFLALHLLQPESRRRVLVLDDPAAAFDDVNRAGFAATLRAFARLLRPDQIVVATHDEAVATLLADELSPVDEWPSAVGVIRCARDRDDQSTAVLYDKREISRDLRADEEMLGLGGEPTLFTA
jgi:hypothetical protein